MSFFAQPQLTPGVTQSYLGPIAINFNDDMTPLIGGLKLIASGLSLAANVENLIFDAASPGYLYNLCYLAVGANIQNVRIRISDNDVANVIDVAGNSAAGIPARGGFLIGGAVTGPTLASIYGIVVPLKRMKIYVTTQFTDAQSTIALYGSYVKVSS